MSDIFFDPILDPILRLTAMPELPPGSGDANPGLGRTAPAAPPEDERSPSHLRSLEVFAREQQATIRRLRQRVREVERELDILREYVRSIRCEAVPDTLTLGPAEQG